MASAARSIMASSGRGKRKRIDPAVKLALSIVPAQQVANDRFVLKDVANHSEADQRHMVRSGEKRTVRRQTHIEKLAALKILTLRQAAICQWFADQREIGYATIGCTANYCGAGGGGFGSSDLLARYKAQAEARTNYTFARRSVELKLLPLLEKVLIGNEGLVRGKPTRMILSDDFRSVVEQLEESVGHLAIAID